MKRFEVFTFKLSLTLGITLGLTLGIKIFTVL